MHNQQPRARVFTQHVLFYSIDGSEDFIEGDKQHLLDKLLSMFVGHLPPLMRLSAASERATEAGLRVLILDAGIAHRVKFSLTPMLVVRRAA